uniref:CSON002859 protein n=1 Tax=Culicoides sonorensis TaxID=179676 RepID=A0A336MR81_CULSO
MANTMDFDLSLDEIIKLRANKEQDDVLELDEDMTFMDEDDLEAPTTVSSFGNSKDPDLSVNWRLRSENIIDRPTGMPPLLSRTAQKQLEELEEMKQENRLHELTDRYDLNSTCNRSISSRRNSVAGSRAGSRVSTMRNFGVTKQNDSKFDRNRQSDPIGKSSVRSEAVGGRDLRSKLTKFMEMKKQQQAPVKQVEIKQENALALPGMQGEQLKTMNFKQLLESKGLTDCVEVINTSFGPKYDMGIQREIAFLQKKPLTYACGINVPITVGGAGIEGPKLKALGTKLSLNSRFAQY